MTVLTPLVFSGMGGASGSTWSPSDKSAFIDVTGGNLTATALGGGPGDSLIRGTLSKTSGNLCFEMQVTDRVDGETAIGLANSTADVNNFLGADANSIGWYKSGNIYINGSPVLTGPLYAVNDFISGEIAFGTKRIWFRNNGAPTVWNAGGTADPETGVGGVDFSAITGPFFICADIPVQPGVMTLNTGSSAFNVAPTASYSAWG